MKKNSIWILILWGSFSFGESRSPITDHETSSVFGRFIHPTENVFQKVTEEVSKLFQKWRSDLQEPNKRKAVLPKIKNMPLNQRELLLLLLKDVPLSAEEYIDTFLDFSQVKQDETQTEEMVEFLFKVYQDAKSRRLLTPALLRKMGYLFAGDSFKPESPGFARLSRGRFEKVRDASSEDEKRWLDAGIRDRFGDNLSVAPSVTPRDSVSRLITAKNIWTDKKYSESADFLIGKPFVGSWDFAVKNLGLLFLLKAREVSPEAKRISDETVRNWLLNLENPAATELSKKLPDHKNIDGNEELQKALSQIGMPELLKQLEEEARLKSNRHKEGVIDSPSIIFGHQYRNLILKEILKNYPLKEEQKKIIQKQLDENEKELTEQLSLFERGETTTDEITGYNTYTLVTTILAAKDPSRALDVIREKSSAPYAPYRIYSDYKATSRAGAARTVPYRLAELAHEKDPEKQKLLKRKLAEAATNFMNYLPDLMFHARGNFMHRGDDQLAPYFFHPAVPFEAAALRLLSTDSMFSLEERGEFNKMRGLLAKTLIASQKKEGTFSLPDTVGDSDGDGAYSSSPAWVNPLTGLALLSLIDDTVESQTKMGILDPDSFK